MQITASACPPALDYARRDRPLCPEHNRATLGALVRDKRILSVVLAINFAAYPISDWPLVAAGLDRAVEELVGAGKRVVVLGPIPIMPFDPPSALGMMAARGVDLSRFGLSREEFDSSSRFAAEVTQRLHHYRGATVIDVAAILCDSSNCPAYRHGALYFNRDHLSIFGARRVVNSVDRQLLDALNLSKQ